MEWIGSLIAAFILILLVVPALVAVGSVFLLGVAGWISLGSPSVGKAAFRCPISRRRVSAAFLTLPGTEQPSDVVSCSRFKNGRAITCQKGCLSLAVSGWGASPMAPRYALLSGDVAFRPIAGPAK